MRIRGVVKPRKGSTSTVTDASVTTAPGVADNGASQVTLFVISHDAHDMKSVVVTLVMSVQEARGLSEALSKHAFDAEVMAGR